jgi:hypothetical protein
MRQFQIKEMRINTFSYVSILLISISLIITGCEGKQELDSFQFNKGTEYTPIHLNSSWQYKVDSILFKKDVTGISRDTLRYVFRDKVLDMTIGLNGDSLFLIERRKVSSGIEFIELFQIRKTSTHYVNTIDNQSIISFVYPPRLGRRWNGLSLFNANEWTEFILNEPVRKYKDWTDFRYSDVNLSISILDETFDNVIKVLQTDIENAIERRYSSELYAPNKGMIFKEIIILDTQNISNAAWEDKAERGYIVRQTLISP